MLSAMSGACVMIYMCGHFELKGSEVDIYGNIRDV